MYKARALCMILVLSIGLILPILATNSFCDEAGDPYSSQPATNIGAWYDETWQATGFYYLTGAATNWQYEYASDPLNLPAAATPPSPDATDVVVTEWSVTGHVHFSSGL